MHAYVIDYWIRLPILVFVKRVIDGSCFKNLTKVIVATLLRGGGLMKKNMSKKFLCFGRDGVNVFQGGKTRITKQIKDSWAPFSMGVHCVAHRTNLVIQSLTYLVFMAWIKMFMQNMYGYFNHSPKQHLEIGSSFGYQGEQNHEECPNGCPCCSP
jgi:hypothetical protein